MRYGEGPGGGTTPVPLRVPALGGRAGRTCTIPRHRRLVTMETLGLVLMFTILGWASYRFLLTLVPRKRKTNDVWRTIDRWDRARDKSWDEPRAKRTLDE